MKLCVFGVFLFVRVVCYNTLYIGIDIVVVEACYCIQSILIPSLMNQELFNSIIQTNNSLLNTLLRISMRNQVSIR